jgi:hypothetical protein
MKKIVILFITIIVATATANAQFFIEGSVGFRYADSSDTDYSSSSLSIAPSIGYWLNNKVAIGISPGFGGENIDGTIDTGLENEERRRNWLISVFGRYKLWEKEKFSILIKTPVGYGTTNYKNTKDTYTLRDNSMSYFQVSAFPLVSYKLGERFDIIAECSFFSLSFSSTAHDDKAANAKSTSNQFNFGAKSSIFNSLGNISIGFVYNFKNKSSQR